MFTKKYVIVNKLNKGLMFLLFTTDWTFFRHHYFNNAHSIDYLFFRTAFYRHILVDIKKSIASKTNNFLFVWNKISFVVCTT